MSRRQPLRATDSLALAIAMVVVASAIPPTHAHSSLALWHQSHTDTSDKTPTETPTATSPTLTVTHAHTHDARLKADRHTNEIAKDGTMGDGSSVMVTARQPVPVGLTCKHTATESVTVAWASVPDATLYDVAVGDADTIANAPYFSQTATPDEATGGLEIGDLLSGTAYSVKVRAHVHYGGDQMVLGWTNFSTPVVCATKEPHPLAPRHVRRATSTQQHTALDVAWDMPTTTTSMDGGRGRVDATSTHRADVSVPVYTVCIRNIRDTTLAWREMVVVEGDNATVHGNTMVVQVSGLESASSYEVRVSATYHSLHSGTTSPSVTHTAPLARFHTADPNTVWIEPHRVSENHLTTVDFLANHNSGTLEGDIAFMTFAGNLSHFFNLYASPLTSYCVEILKVDLSNTTRTPSNPASIPPNPQFADYLSCNGDSRDPPPGTGWGNYTCLCDNSIDRFIAHQTSEMIHKLCGPGGIMSAPCVCDNASLATSAQYTGFMATSLPWITFPAFHGGPIPEPPTSITPFGGWYSHPSAAKCADSTGKVGDDGCTWRRDPRQRMVYGTDLIQHGWVVGNASTAHIQTNLKAATAAFAAVPIKPRCCGC